MCVCTVWMEHEASGSCRCRVCRVCGGADHEFCVDADNIDSVALMTSAGRDDASSAAAGEMFVDQSRAGHLLQAISQLYIDSLFTDVTLCVGTDEIKCHRNVLAASSAFFLGMFQSELSESRQSKIPIKEMEASTLRLVLDYVYTGKVSLTVDNVQSVLSAANLFQMIALRDGCAKFMVHHVSVDNCVGVMFFARAHECYELAECARQLITAEFDAVSHLPELLSLPADKLIDIISDDQVRLSHMLHSSHTSVTFACQLTRMYQTLRTHSQPQTCIACCCCYYMWLGYLVAAVTLCVSVRPCSEKRRL